MTSSTPHGCIRCGRYRPHKAHGLCPSCYNAARRHGELPVAGVQLTATEREVRIADGWRALLLAISEEPGDRIGGGDRRRLALVNGGRS